MNDFLTSLFIIVRCLPKKKNNKNNFSINQPKISPVPASCEIPGDLSPQMGMYCTVIPPHRGRKKGKNTSTGCKIDIVNRKRKLDGEL